MSGKEESFRKEVSRLPDSSNYLIAVQHPVCTLPAALSVMTNINGA